MSDSPSTLLTIGNFAPDFVLRDQHGDLIKLSDFKNRSVVVLYFYPKDETLACTKEAKCFRDNYEAFMELGAVVIGISSDGTCSHSRFANKHNLPFSLLSDTHGKVREMYGIPRKFWLIPGRVTFVIDKDGIIRHIFESQFQATKHIFNALEIVKNLNKVLK
jgi:peroxiredoxin Q/BCP